MTNKLIQGNITKNGVINFNKLKYPSLLKEFKESLKEREELIETVINNIDCVSFESFLKPIASTLEHLENIQLIAHGHKSMSGSKKMNDLYNYTADELLAQDAKMLSNSQFYQKVKNLHKNRISYGLNDEETKLVLHYYKKSKEYNILSKKSKDTLIDIINKTDSLGNKFISNVSTGISKKGKVLVYDFETIKDMPEDSIALAKKLAIKNKKPNTWLFKGHRQLLELTIHAHDSSIREKAYLGIENSSYNNEYCNYKLIKKFINLSQKEASLFKKKSYADYVLSETMLKNPKNVESFLQEEFNSIKTKSLNDFSKLVNLAKIHQPNIEIKPSDEEYYINKYKSEILGWESDTITNCFTLNKVLDFLTTFLSDKFNIILKQVDCSSKKFNFLKIYKVFYKDQHLGTMYYDMKHRDTKEFGTFMRDLMQKSQNCVPHILISSYLNDAANPCMDLQEIEDIFHETGHAMTQLLCNNNYINTNGMNVSYDLVEFASQLFEKFPFEPQNLRKMSLNPDTGKPLTISQCESLIEYHYMFKSLDKLKMIQKSFLDLYLFSNKYNKNILKIEKVIANKYSFYQDESILLSTTFEHAFDGDYSSKFYCYLYSKNFANKLYAKLKKKNFTKTNNKVVIEELFSGFSFKDELKSFKRCMKRIK